MKENSLVQRALPFISINILRTLALLTVCSMIACASGSSSDDDSGDNGDGGNLPDGQVDSSFTISARTNSSGIARVQFRLAAGSTKFAASAFTPSSSHQIRFIELVSSSGTNYLNPGGQEISFAELFSSGVNAINAPSRNVDPDLGSDETYTLGIEASTSGGGALSDSDISVLVTSRADGNFGGGTLIVNLFFVGEVGNEDNVRQVVELAVAEFRSIYAQLGVTLDVRSFSIDGPLILPSPFDGSSFYESASNSVGTLGVNIFISGDVANGAGGILGIAGGIIAPPVPSQRSALAVGIIPGAGPDGVYSTEDIRILGETFAHESGHYVGLFHPVDFSGESASATDPLSDTPTCSTFTACLGNEALTRNLMFTTPVSNGSGGFVPQNQLTGQQAGVVNRYVAVD